MATELPIVGVTMTEKTVDSIHFQTIFSLLAVLGLAAMATVWASPVYAQAAISKCQDADGKWHYGNFADEACGNAVVDKIHETGTKVGEDKPPPTAEELAQEQDLAKLEEQQKKFKAEERTKDLETIRIYGTEETIISTRDRKLASIDNNIEVTRQIKAGTLKDIEKLNKVKKTKKVKRQLAERENAVKSYNRVIRHNLTEREKLSDKYISILTEFREAHLRIYGK